MEKDNITLKRIKELHPKLQDEALQIYNELFEKGIYIRFTFIHRTYEQQDALYSQGRQSLEIVNKLRKDCGLYEISADENKKVTNAKGGRSFHNYNVAIDFCLLDKNNSYNMKYDMNKNNKSDWMEVVEVFKKYGWAWGSEANFKGDTPHFQKTFGYNIDQLQEKYLAKDFIKNTNFLNL